VSVLQAVVMGLLQGVTEFVPVSSSGHLVLVPWLLGWEVPGLTYDAVVHLGTLAALLVHFRRRIRQLATGWWQSLRRQNTATDDARLSWLVLASAMPGALFGLLGRSFFEGLLGSPWAVSLLLLVTGAILVVSERLGRKVGDLQGLRPGDALAIGLAQGLAIAPGISRSGATIAAGMLLGLRRDEAAQFSFLTAMPMIAGAAAASLLKAAHAGDLAPQAPQLGAGFLAAMATGYLAVRFLLGYVRRRNLRPFAWYCWGVGLLGLALSLLAR